MPMLADGTVLAVDDGTESAYVAIPDVIEYDPPTRRFGSYDATALDSTAGTMIKAPKTRSDPGQFTYLMFYSETQYERLKLKEGAASNHRITYPDGAIDTIPGFIASIERQKHENQEPAKMLVTVEVTGLVART